MDGQVETKLYGAMFRHLTDLATDSGMEAVVVQLDNLDEFEVRMLLAHLVNLHATA